MITSKQKFENNSLHCDDRIDPTYETICDPIGQLEFEMDVQTTLDSLPKPEKQVCIMLLSGATAKQICEKLRITRSSLFQQHLPIIKKRFLEYGFEKKEISFGI